MQNKSHQQSLISLLTFHFVCISIPCNVGHKHEAKKKTLLLVAKISLLTYEQAQTKKTVAVGFVSTEFLFCSSF